MKNIRLSFMYLVVIAGMFILSISLWGHIIINSQSTTETINRFLMDLVSSITNLAALSLGFATLMYMFDNFEAETLKRLDTVVDATSSMAEDIKSLKEKGTLQKEQKKSITKKK